MFLLGAAAVNGFRPGLRQVVQCHFTVALYCGVWRALPGLSAEFIRASMRSLSLQALFEAG